MSVSLQELEETPAVTVSDRDIYMIPSTGPCILKQISVHIRSARKLWALHSSSLQTNAGEVPQAKPLQTH